MVRNYALNKIKTVLMILGSFFALTTITAEDFFLVGARSMGMGGAGVSANKGAKNVYWNPARLAFDKKIDFSISPVNLNVEVVGTVVKLVDEFNKLPDFDQLQSSYENGFDQNNPTHVENARLAFKLIFDDVIDFHGDDGLLIHNTSAAGIHFNISKHSFALTGSVSATLGVSALIDIDYGELSLVNTNAVRDELSELFPNPEHTYDDITSENRTAARNIVSSLQASEIISQSADEASLQEMLYQADQAGVNFNDPLVQDAIEQVVKATQPDPNGEPNTAKTFEEALNTSGFLVKGLILQAVKVSYARKFGENFSIGTNINLYQGRAFKRFVTLDDMDTYEIPKSYSDLNEEDFEDSYNVGLDLGVSYEPISGLTFGLVGKDINSPGFSFRSGGEYVLHPQARFGVAFRKDLKILSFMVAGDIDLIENETDSFDDARYRQVALGAEVNLFKFLFIRGGYNDNLSARNGKASMYTAGVGFYFFGFSIDVSAGMGNDQVKIDDQRYPTRGGLAFELQWNRNF